jgi:hypothetical protein
MPPFFVVGLRIFTFKTHVSGIDHRPSSSAKAGDPVFQGIAIHHRRSGIARSSRATTAMI